MILDKVVDVSGWHYGAPAMVLNMSSKNDLYLAGKLTDEQILHEFDLHEELEAIVVTGLPDPVDKIDELRAFIFAVRKHFPPGERPRLVIYTKYFVEELERKSWHGVQYELLHYGHAFLKCGRLQLKTKKSKHVNKFAKGNLLASPYEVITYEGTQHM